MPHITVHFLVARNALRAWRQTPTDAPFDFNDPALINAYYHGALAPDMGYFPGGCEHMSNLAHESCSADLNRVLLRTAPTDTARAFCIGWLTHILADAALHPLINRAADALLRRQGDGEPATASARRVAHVRVELGLDAAFLACAGDVALIRVVPWFDAVAVEHIRSAFGFVYGHEVDGAQLLRSHRAVARLASAWLSLERIVAGNFARMRTGSFARRARALTRASILYAVRSPAMSCGALGFLTPVQPSPWLMRQAQTSVAGVGAVLRAPPDLVLATLPNVNLDAGVERPATSPVGPASSNRRMFVTFPLQNHRHMFVTFPLQNLSIAET
jgi:hypothetical protein